MKQETHDGTRLMVTFYANQGVLYKVALSSGVPIKNLRTFIDTGEISKKHRAMLESKMRSGK